MISGSGAINPQRSRESRLWIQEPDLSPLTYRNQLRKTLFQSVAPIFFFICSAVLSLRELFCFWSAVSELLSQHIRTNYSLRVDWSGERPEPAAVWNELSFFFMCATAKKSSGALPTPKASLKAASFFVHPGVPLQWYRRWNLQYALTSTQLVSSHPESGFELILSLVINTTPNWTTVCMKRSWIWLSSASLASSASADDAL